MKSKYGSFISTLAAGLNAACCVIPIVLLTLGFTNLGLFAVFMRYRPITLPISFLLLSAAFYVVYRPQAESECARGICSPRSLRRQRLFVWLSAVLMLLFTLIPLLPITIKM